MYIGCFFMLYYHLKAHGHDTGAQLLTIRKHAILTIYLLLLLCGNKYYECIQNKVIEGISV